MNAMGRVLGFALAVAGVLATGLLLGAASCNPPPVPVGPGPVDATSPSTHGCPEACAHYTAIPGTISMDGCREICDRLAVNMPGYPDCLFAASARAAVDTCAR